MWLFIKCLLTRPFAALRRLFSRGRRDVAQGRWLDAEFSDPQGVLFYAPMLAPKRAYRLYFPAGYDAGKAYPLLVMLHGCKQDPVEFAAGTRMNALADTHGVLVLYPEQRRWANSYRCWNWFDPSGQTGKGEAALIAGMTREVCANHAVDRERIYVAGLSAGGAMAITSACTHADLYAACAVHSGLMFRAADSPSTAVRAMKHGSPVAPADAAQQSLPVLTAGDAPLPVLVIHGSADATVNPVNADQIIEQFLCMAELAGVGSEVTAATTSTRIEGEDSAYACDVYDYRHRGRLLARKIIVEGLGHAWSGGDAKHPFNDPKGPDACRMIWDFVAQFRRTAPNPAAAEALILADSGAAGLAPTADQRCA